MKMKEYNAPEMQVIEMKYSQALLDASFKDNTNPGLGGDGTPGLNDPD